MKLLKKKQKQLQQILMKKKKAICKTKFFYILLVFLLINIALWIAVSIYCYLLKYGAKQKHVLRVHDTNNELNQAFLLII